MEDTVAPRPGGVLIAALNGVSYWLAAVMVISVLLSVLIVDAVLIVFAAAFVCWTLVATVQWTVWRADR